MNEAQTEAACRRHADALGCPSFKLQSGIVGAPDRLFLLPGRRAWVVEFKAPEGTLSPRQKIVHAELARLGHPVAVVRTLQQFKLRLALEMQATVE